MKINIGLIAAHDQNNLMGIDNGLPWKIKEEMAFFKDTTINNIVIMGSNTYYSLKKPLVNRLNLVISSKKIKNNDIYCFDNIDVCLKFCGQFDKKIFVIGGASIYRYFLDNNLIDYMYISTIKTKVDQKGSCLFFPRIIENEWDKSLFLSNDLFEVNYYKKK